MIFEVPTEVTLLCSGILCRLFRVEEERIGMYDLKFIKARFRLWPGDCSISTSATDNFFPFR
jgi:hypothetical protein